MTAKEIYKKVQWQDLRKLNGIEFLIENSLPLPWLIISLALAYLDYYIFALPFSGFFFLAGLRQSHNGFHNCLGINKFFNWFVLYWNSLWMMTSIHAVKFNHMRHHRFCLAESDYEGKAASMSWYKAIFYGPMHTFLIHKITLQIASPIYKRNVVLEILSIIVFLVIIFYFQVSFLIYHAIVMIFGEFLMSFFAVWAVHQGTLEKPNFARTQRTGWKNRLTFNMFYHLEHHLFPAVPTIKLPELARRIDQAWPDIEKRTAF